MTLQQLAAGSRPVPVLQVGGDEALAREIQTRLGDIGLLDPPADGHFGPVSHWALGQFLRRVDLVGKTELDAELARELLDATADGLYPIKAGTSLAARLTAALLAKGHWINRHPECMNIVYVEGMDEGGKPNTDDPNEFNDLRLLLRINRTGGAGIVDQWEGTTEPGKFFTSGPQKNKDGAARIAFGQYKAWSVGTHRPGARSAHEALVQVAPIAIFRDLDEDFERAGDKLVEGLFGINQHWGFDLPKTDIRNASAGCLVGRTKVGHRAFMTACKSDARFLVNNGYRFMTAVLSASDV